MHARARSDEELESLWESQLRSLVQDQLDAVCVCARVWVNVRVGFSPVRVRLSLCACAHVCC